MHDSYINRLDLNLLKSLHALLSTQSVSKAAKLMNLSQPAMSRALNRLQHALKDPLLVRSGRSMVLTPRAEQLRSPVQNTVANVASIFKPNIFDPSHAENKFRIMAPDYIAQLIMPRVLTQIFTIAPLVQVEMVNLSAPAIEDMCEGKLSLGFGVVNDGPELRNVCAQSILEDNMVCLMRRNHKLSKEKLSLEKYAQAAHALLSITGSGKGRIDEVLAQYGLSRQISLRITHFLTINKIIASTDLIITVPKLLAKQVMSDELIMRNIPKELKGPPFSFAQIWHERFTKDPAHQWLRKIIKNAAQQN